MVVPEKRTDAIEPKIKVNYIKVMMRKETTILLKHVRAILNNESFRCLISLTISLVR
jgi:hypothetical protein